MRPAVVKTRKRLDDVDSVVHLDQNVAVAVAMARRHGTVRRSIDAETTTTTTATTTTSRVVVVPRFCVPVVQVELTEYI
jgi:hypothetical protein